MRIVLDTNILWISIPNSSPSNWLIRDLLAQRYTLCVTTDILEEYEEIIERFLGSETAQNFYGIFRNTTQRKESYQAYSMEARYK